MALYRIRFSDHSVEGPLPEMGRGEALYAKATNIANSAEKWFLAGRQWRRWEDLSGKQRVALKSYGLAI